MTYIPDDAALLRMMDFLNDGKHGREPMADEDASFLRALMKDWQAARGNWQRFIKARLEARRSVDFVNGTFNIPTNAPRPVLVPYPKHGARAHANGVFFWFALHPESWRLAGPCRRKGCGRYFIRKTAHTRDYCSARCASNDSSLAIMRAKRAAKRAEQVRAVEAAIGKYNRQRRRGDWRAYVETETGITPRTLDGWVKAGFIEAPIERRQKP